MPTTSSPPAGNLFANFELFADASTEALELLTRIAVRRTLAPKVVVVRQGDSDDSWYGVLDGLLQVAVQGSDGREIVLNLLRGGDTFGDVTLFDPAARSATVSTLKRTELVVFPAEPLREAARRHPELCFAMLCSMARLVRRLTTRVEELSALPIQTRLARKLLEISEICGTRLGANQVALPAVLSQQDLANHLQVTRESVNKNLAGWLRDGTLGKTQSQLIICDRERLERIASGKATQL